MTEIDEMLMRVALDEAARALDDGEFPVGVVLAKGDAIVARSCRQNSRAQSRNELDHAEICALRELCRTSPDMKPQELTLYSTLEPCLMCYSTLLLSGVRRIVWAYEDVMGGGTALELSRLNPLYREMQVELVPQVLRNESLGLFKRFFQTYDYWQDSILSRYTLSQEIQ